MSVTRPSSFKWNCNVTLPVARVSRWLSISEYQRLWIARMISPSYAPNGVAIEQLARDIGLGADEGAAQDLEQIVAVRAYVSMDENVATRRQQIEEAILSLERLARGRGRRRGRPPSWLAEVTGKRRGRPPGSKNKAAAPSSKGAVA